MRVGIVGCGGVSLVHIKSLIKTGKCEIVSVCDLNRNRAADLAKQYGIPGVYTDFSAMLRKENLDIVNVLTPPQAHAKLSIEAMDAGCHVLVEKPMCMTVKEADQMIEASKRNDVKFGVIHSYLYTPAIQQALNAVKNGELGDLIRVDTLVSLYPLLGWNDGKTEDYPSWYYTLQGALFGEIIPHGLYVQLAFLGKIKNVFGLTRTTEKSTDLLPFSDLQILMNCENAVGGLFVSSRIKTPYALILTRIIGSKGVMVANIPAATVTKTKLSRTESFPIIETNRLFTRAMLNIEPAVQMLSKTVSLGGKALLGSIGLEMTHETIVKGFVDAIERDTEPLVTGDDGREVIKTTNMLWENILK
jgi:predicted dehydrogenase